MAMLGISWAQDLRKRIRGGFNLKHYALSFQNHMVRNCCNNRVSALLFL